MSYSYLVPYLLPLPVGYDFAVALPSDRIAARLICGSGTVVWRNILYHGGECIQRTEQTLTFENGARSDAAPLSFFWQGADKGWDDAGYLEMHFDAADEATRFVTNDSLAVYGLYAAPGRKTFRADGAYKFASPMTINQLAAFGRFNESYPAVLIDRAQGYGESLCLINPYEKPILASVSSHDGRTLPRTRINPMSARNVRLTDLLKEGEERFRGRVQVSASNRIAVFHIRHDFSEPPVITDHEHSDPYRSDPTHIPAFQKLRAEAGRVLDEKFGINWHRL